MKYTYKEWVKLTRDEQREALLKFQEPDSIRQQKVYTSLNNEKE